MSLPIIKYCPGNLTNGYKSYSTTCLRRMFKGRKVNHILPYESPTSNKVTDELFLENRKRISISGVQEKFSVLLDKNKLRLINEGEQGLYILKPIPNVGNNTDQMPANEHLTMQIAKQVFDIETAPIKWDTLAESQQEYLVRYAKNDEEVETQEAASQPSAKNKGQEKKAKKKETTNPVSDETENSDDNILFSSDESQPWMGMDRAELGLALDKGIAELNRSCTKRFF